MPGTSPACMSVAPNFPSNCRDITDAQMRSFCYGVSSWGSLRDCNNVTDPNTRAFCFGMSLQGSLRQPRNRVIDPAPRRWGERDPVGHAFSIAINDPALHIALTFFA